MNQSTSQKLSHPQAASTICSGLEMRIGLGVRKVAEFCDKNWWWLSALIAGLLLWKGLLVARSGRYGDFQPLVNAAQRLLAGQSLYVTGVTYPEFVYSPFIGLLLYPAGYLSPTQFRMVWLILNMVALAGIGLVSFRFLQLEKSDRFTKSHVIVMTLLAAWPWLLGNLFNGQINPILMCLALFGAWYSLNGSWILGGVLLALAMHIKPFPIVFFVPLAFRGELKACMACCMWYVLFISLPLTYFGAEYPSVLQGWFDANREQQTIYDAADWGHQSLSSLVFRMFGASNPAPFSLDLSSPMYLCSTILNLTVVIVSGLMLWKHRSHRAFGVCIAAILWPLIPPTSWKHYYLMLFLPLMSLSRRAIFGGASARGAGWIVGVCALFGFLRFISAFGDHHFVYSLSYCVWVALAVWGFLLRHPEEPQTATPIKAQAPLN